MAIDRTVFNASVDDTGSGTTGTIINKSWLGAAILDPVDAFISSAAPGVLVGVSVYHSTTQNLSNSVLTTLLFNAEDFDTSGFHDTATNTDRLTVPTGKAGTYLVCAGVTFSGFGGTGYGALTITKNGTAIGTASQGAFSGMASYVTATLIVPLAVSDYVTAKALQSSSGGMNSGSATYADRNWLSMIRVGV